MEVEFVYKESGGRRSVFAPEILMRGTEITVLMRRSSSQYYT
jgi:hypothetical protein